ncbi:hypothetical protein BH23BAC2_BH23BAC2_01950 [soil metagenome]
MKTNGSFLIRNFSTNVCFGLIGLLIICSAPVFSQNTGFYSFLPNSDGVIDRKGFDIGYAMIYSQWDLNSNGEITETEFLETIFNRLDQNQDGTLAANEWAVAQKYLFEGLVTSGKNEFKNFDSNGDKNMSKEEFMKGVKAMGLFGYFDINGDGKLSLREICYRVFNQMDLDNNGTIDQKEFSKVNKLFIN